LIMGFVRKRQGKRGVHYQARWTDDLGHEQVKVFTRKTEADNHIKIVEAAKLKGEYVDTASKVTVAEYAREWASNRSHRASTAVRVKSLVEKHIAQTRLGTQRLSAVKPSEVQAWIADRSRVLSPGTLRLLVTLVRSIFAAAVLDRKRGSNPVPARLSLPRSEKPRIVPLTVEQVDALADAVPERCAAMVITQAGLGLRIAELLALRVQDVDFARRTVKVDWQLTQNGLDRVEPKTPRSKRVLPLPQIVRDALVAHIAKFPPSEDGSLFTTVRGKLYRQEHYQARHFAPAVRRAGLPDGTTTHDLRHHFASIMLAAGLSVVAVAELLGHENANLVLSTYGHLVPGSEDRMRQAVDSAWSYGQKSEALGASVK
jgi:integrase